MTARQSTKTHRNCNDKWCERNKKKIDHSEIAQQRNFTASIQKIQNQQDKLQKDVSAVEDNFSVGIIKQIKVNGIRELATPNLVEGLTVYGEKLVKIDDEEYRIWDPFRSKLAAALKKGLRDFPIGFGDKILYLGASTGTTVSHVSDLVGNKGLVFAVEPAVRVARELIENVASRRKNVIPIIEDARRPESYFSIFGTVDLVYCDIAQSDQTEIAIKNCNAFLKNKGIMLVVIKTRSIDVTMSPRSVVAMESDKLRNNDFVINQTIDLEPFDKDHALIHATYSPTK
jgi:fibrillarin-like pre-rRNA processing protein